MGKEKKTVELWDGFVVDVDEKLIDDFDFTSELSEAMQNNDLKTLATMYMALVGGEETYTKVREHIEEQHGYFSQEAFVKIVQKIDGVLPKAGNRAQRRSWKTSHQSRRISNNTIISTQTYFTVMAKLVICAMLAYLANYRQQVE